jgi:adenine phosphoribosyltransferase
MDIHNSDTIIQVNFIMFIWYVIKCLSFKIAIEKLCVKYKTENLVVKFFWKKLYILQSDIHVKKILSKDAESQLTYVNDIFFSSHGHKFGIGNLNYHNSPCLWQEVHSALTKAVNFHDLPKLMEDNFDIFLKRSVFSLNDNLEEYIMTIWSKFSFGLDTDVAKYKIMRSLLITTIRKTYYNQSTNYIPFIGKLLSHIRLRKHQKDFKRVDLILGDLILNGNDGLIQRFATNLAESNDKEVIENIDKIVLDNAFLNVLVFDFIYIFLLNAMVHIAKNSIDDYNERMNNKKEYIKGAFLFPIRFRKIGNDIDIFKKGDYAIINLISSDLFFSFGPRTCIGRGFVDKFYKTFFDLVKNYKFRFVDKTQEIAYNNNCNIPIIISNHKIRIEYDKDYLKKNLKHYEHKGMTEFYSVESIPQDVVLFDFIIEKMCNIIQNIGNIHGIITAEARGFIFASPVANKLLSRLYLVRKKGKLAGPVHQITYKKEYDEYETLEIQKDINLINQNNIIIDDGIASGSTTDAMYQLSKMTGANILAVIVCVKHHYTECKYDTTPVYNIFDL